MRSLSLLLPFAIGFAGCAVEVSGLRLDELNRSLDARIVVIEERFSVYSPFNSEITADFSRVILEELTLGAELFEVTISEPVVFYLVPLEEQDRFHLRDGSHTGTLDGLARHTREIVIYVDPQLQSTDGLPPHVRQNIRHEVAHICLNLTGHRVDTWLHEGIAEEVESRLPLDGHLVSHPVPENLVGVTTVPARHRSLEHLLSWRRGFDPDRYARWLAHSFVRYFLSRHEKLSFRDGIGLLVSLDRRSLLAEEAGWLHWLDSLDCVELLESLAGAGNEALEVDLAMRLKWMVLNNITDPFSQRTDEIAIELLENPKTCSVAQFYFLYARYRELSDETVDELAAAMDPRFYLTGQALRARRGTNPDRVTAQVIWEALNTDVKLQVVWAYRFLFTDEPPDSIWR